MKHDERQFKKLFSRLKSDQSSQPSKEWLESTRAALQKHIQSQPYKVSQPVHEKGLFSNPGWAFLMKPVSIALIVLIIVLGAGGGSVYAAQESDPGDVLYPLKLAGEQFSLMVTVSPKAKATLYMKYATRRLEELERLYEKNPGDTYWQEKVVDDMTQKMVETKSVLNDIENSEDKDLSATYTYTDVALEFEALTQQQQDRLSQLEAERKIDTDLIFKRIQELTDLHHQKAIEAVEKAQEKFEKQERSKLQENHQIEDRLQTRLELIRARQEAARARMEEQFESAQNKFNIKNDDIDEKLQESLPSVPESTASDTGDLETREYEAHATEDGIEYNSTTKIESNGSEEVNSTIDIDDGRVIIDSSIEATGTTIIIEDSTSIRSESRQQIRVNGKDIHISE